MCKGVHPCIHSVDLVVKAAIAGSLFFCAVVNHLASVYVHGKKNMLGTKSLCGAKALNCDQRGGGYYDKGKNAIDEERESTA